MPLQVVQRHTTSTEFLEWCAYIDWEANAFHREDYYWAQIAEVMYKAWMGRKGKKTKLADFLLKFKSKDKKAEKLTPDERLKKQKSFWKAVTGYAWYGRDRT